MLLMENATRHFTAPVCPVAHWLLNRQRRRHCRGRGLAVLLPALSLMVSKQGSAAAMPQILGVFWEFQMNVGELKYSGRPTENIESTLGHSVSQLKM